MQFYEYSYLSGMKISNGNMIRFFNEDSGYRLRNKTLVRKWLFICANREHKTIEHLNIIFCSDKYLKKINKQYLGHDYFTDIITFPYFPEDNSKISGDIFISTERIRENAKLYGSTMGNELCRVMVHGVLHLCGYSDKTDKERKAMKKKEDACLALLGKSFHG